MGFKCGIVGLPNVGKSTLFNALTKTASAQAANYPFCTIEPNIGEVGVPDERLYKISKISNSQNTLPTRINFVDIAGLVKGASKGEGLGNKFLSHIREVDAIIYVLRCFEDDNITHVEGKIDPIYDANIIETELLIADMESLEKRRDGLSKKIRGADKLAKATLEIADKCLELLNDGKPARHLELSDDEDAKLFKELNLLTSKPILYVCNVSEDDIATGNEMVEQVRKKAEVEGAHILHICASLEEELISLDDEERQEYLKELKIKEPGLNRLIRHGYELLDLVTYFTSGPKESRAWTVRRNSKAPKAAGIIHTDFEKGFIRAEIISYDDFIAHQGEQGAKEKGKMRLEGKDYIIEDGDIAHFRFNV